LTINAAARRLQFGLRRLDRAGVFHAGRRRRFGQVELDLERGVVRRSDEYLGARAQRRRSLRRGDRPRVFHRVREQHHIALARRDPAEIHDARIAVALERQRAAPHEILVAHVERRRRERRRIDHRIAPDHDAFRVDQEEFSVRLERTEQPGRVAAHHAREHRCVRAGLRNPHLLAHPDVERPPVDDRVARALRQRHRAARLRDGDITRGYLSSGG
jgi:hypothetical protein